MGNALLLLLGVTACSGGSSHVAQSPAVVGVEADAVAIDVQATPVVVAGVAVDAGVVGAVDAGVAPTPQTCFCFSWVHLDQNGQSCFATKATCDVEFKDFGRDTKIPCEAQRERCGTYACRKLGKDCVAF